MFFKTTITFYVLIMTKKIKKQNTADFRMHLK